MTHFNPFSFPMHLAVDLTALIWLWVISSFFGFSFWKAARTKRDLKFWCYFLLWLHVWAFIVYDISVVLGAYYFNPLLPGGMQLLQPGQSKKFNYLSNALFDVCCVTHTALLFLLISFWHTLFKENVAERFVKKWEFKAFFVYALISILAYPLTQWPLINHSNPLLVVVVPQYVYSAELIISSILFGVVIYRMKKSQAAGDLERVTPMINLLVKLIYLLIFFNMNLSISFLIINICELAYDGNSLKAKEDLTLGFWEFLQSIFIINFISVVLVIALILNVGKLTRLLSGKGLDTGNSTLSQTEKGTQNSTSNSRSKNSDV